MVVIKRDPGLTDTASFDSSLTAAVSDGTATVFTGHSAIADAGYLYQNMGWASYQIYYNGGAATSATSNLPMLVKFGIDQLAGFLGGKVVKAQLRLYAGGGNSCGTAGLVTTSDWLEGTMVRACPGADGGVSGAFPIGYNTDAYQTADGQAIPGAGQNSMDLCVFGWANNQPFDISKDCAFVGSLPVKRTYPATPGSGDVYMTFDLTQFMQAWANGTPNYGFALNVGNYGFFLSENQTNLDHQPVLLMEYQEHGDPAAITDLTATPADWFQIDLNWTAPSANPPAPVASYDIRYSMSPITDDASFDAAAQCGCTVPTPAEPGTPEHFTINNLDANMTYYFAIKATDVVGTVSAISNVPVSATTNMMDVTAPAQINGLAAPIVKPNYVTLTWTATGDDDMTGQSAGYDLRYSTQPINSDTDFANATALTDVTAPKAPARRRPIHCTV